MTKQIQQSTYEGHFSTEEAKKLLEQPALPYKIQQIEWDQIVRYAPFLQNREDLREKAESGVDVWDYVERGSLYPILRKNKGLAAIWLPSPALDGSFEWRHVYARKMAVNEFFNLIQPTGFLSAALADHEEIWIFTQREPSPVRWQEFFLHDRAILPLVSHSPSDTAYRIHLSPKAYLAWLLTLPTIKMHPEELDAMPETTDGKSRLVTNSIFQEKQRFDPWWRWNIGKATPQLGSQWLVARFSGGVQHSVTWMRFIPEGFDVDALIFDHGNRVGVDPRFTQQFPPKNADVEYGKQELLALSGPEDDPPTPPQKPKKSKKPKPQESARAFDPSDAIDAEFTEGDKP